MSERIPTDTLRYCGLAAPWVFEIACIIAVSSGNRDVVDVFGLLSIYGVIFISAGFAIIAATAVQTSREARADLWFDFLANGVVVVLVALIVAAAVHVVWFGIH